GGMQRGGGEGRRHRQRVAPATFVQTRIERARQRLRRTLNQVLRIGQVDVGRTYGLQVDQYLRSWSVCRSVASQLERGCVEPHVRRQLDLRRKAGRFGVRASDLKDDVRLRAAGKVCK